jgi:hypothetical protein
MPGVLNTVLSFRSVSVGQDPVRSDTAANCFILSSHLLTDIWPSDFLIEILCEFCVLHLQLLSWKLIEHCCREFCSRSVHWSSSMLFGVLYEIRCPAVFPFCSPRLSEQRFRISEGNGTNVDLAPWTTTQRLNVITPASVQAPCRVVNTPASYSGGPRFHFRPQRRAILIEGVRGFPQSLQGRPE